MAHAGENRQPTLRGEEAREFLVGHLGDGAAERSWILLRDLFPVGFQVLSKRTAECPRRFLQFLFLALVLALLLYVL